MDYKMYKLHKYNVTSLIPHNDILKLFSLYIMYLHNIYYYILYKYVIVSDIVCYYVNLTFIFYKHSKNISRYKGKLQYNIGLIQKKNI